MHVSKGLICFLKIGNSIYVQITDRTLVGTGPIPFGLKRIGVQPEQLYTPPKTSSSTPFKLHTIE